MGILMSNEIKNKISEEVGRCKESLHVITAFCKIDGMKFIDGSILQKVDDKKLLVRFRLDDLLAGASDIDIYNFCKNNGWKMYVRFDLHAKTYLFDKKRCVIGSANLTNKGLDLTENSNYEIASVNDLEDEDLIKIHSLFESAVLMTDKIFEKMSLQFDTVIKGQGDCYKWSDEIMELFSPDFSVLFTYDFPNCRNYNDLYEQKIDFLNLESDWTLQNIKEALKLSKSYLWLKTLVSDNGGEMYFGEITAHLHSVLVNDPKPYRKEVKELLGNLLEWIVILEVKDFIIDRPNYSQRVRVI